MVLGDCSLLSNVQYPLILKFKSTLTCLSLRICNKCALLPFFKTTEKHTNVPWRPYKEVECARDFDVGRPHRSAEG